MVTINGNVTVGDGGQLAYLIYTDIQYAGQVYDTNELYNVVSMVNPTDNIYYGRMVKRIAASASQIGQPTTDADDYKGVALRDLADSGKGYFEAGKAVPVITNGNVVVEVDQDVTADDPVYVRFTTAGGGLDLGVFRKDADTNKAVLITNARYISNSVTDKYGVKVAVVKLNLI